MRKMVTSAPHRYPGDHIGAAYLGAALGRFVQASQPGGPGPVPVLFELTMAMASLGLSLLTWSQPNKQSADSAVEVRAIMAKLVHDNPGAVSVYADRGISDVDRLGYLGRLIETVSVNAGCVADDFNNIPLVGQRFYYVETGETTARNLPISFGDGSSMDFLVDHDLMMEGFDQQKLFHFTENVRAATFAVADGVGFIPPNVIYHLLETCPECTSEMSDLLDLAKKSDFALFHSEPVIPGHHAKRLTVEIVRPDTPSSTPSAPASTISDTDSTEVDRKIGRKQNKRGEWVNEGKAEYKKRMKKLHSISHNRSEQYYNHSMAQMITPQDLSRGAASPDMSNAMLSEASTSSSSSSNTVNSPPRPRL
jgi:hypothetical protein